MPRFGAVRPLFFWTIGGASRDKTRNSQEPKKNTISTKDELTFF